jgi:hypothetical protein
MIRCQNKQKTGGRGYIKGRFAGSPFEHHFMFTDIFIRRDSRWIYYKSHSTEIME